MHYRDTVSEGRSISVLGYTIHVTLASLLAFTSFAPLMRLVTVNDEPGTMRPGHCFTIEVWGLLGGSVSLVVLTVVFATAALHRPRIEPQSMDIP